MSTSSELKIYNSAMFLLKDLYQRIPRFDKQYKYLLGERLIDSTIEIIKEISEANNERLKVKRLEHIDKILKKVDEMFVYIRIAEDLKQFKSSSAYPHLIEKISEILRQGTGWKRLYLPQNF
jgi:four helix bundle protein